MKDVGSLQVGDSVRHKAFGTGKVKKVSDGTVVVRLGGKDRMFQYPGASEQGFLELL